MEKSTTLIAPFLSSSLPPETKIIFPWIYFRFKTTDIENKYDLYSRTCANESSMLDGVNYTVSYVPVAGIIYIHIIISIASLYGLVIFVLHISNVFQNRILPNPEERDYLIIPHLYLNLFKIKQPKHQLAPINTKQLYISAIKYIQEKNPTRKLWNELIKYTFIKVKIIRSSYEHTFFPWIKKIYAYFLAVETDDILTAKQKMIFFERMIKYFDTLFEHTLQ